MTLGKRIAGLRKQAGWSQEELGARVGVSRQAVGKWESDKATPDLAALMALSELFGVSLDVLVKGEESAFSRQAAVLDKEPLPKAAHHTLALGLLWGCAALLLALLPLICWLFQGYQLQTWNEAYTNPLDYLTELPLCCLLFLDFALWLGGLLLFLHRPNVQAKLQTFLEQMDPNEPPPKETTKNK